MLSHTDGKGQTTRLLRTARGLPSSRQDAKGQQVRYEYDKAIRLTALVNENSMPYRFAYDASTLPAEKLSQVQNPGINTSLLVEHAYNPIHRRYQYDPAGELVRTLDKLRGEIKYEYEANGQLHSRDTGSLVGSEEFRYDPAANRLDFNARQLEKVKDNRIKRWRDQEYRYDPWGNLIEKRSGLSKLQSFSYDCENRLVRAETLVNGKLESTGAYRYDSLGRRIAKTAEIGGTSEQKHFLWQGLRMLREETPGQSILYLYEPDSYAPLARVDQAEGDEQKVYYFHTDQIGTPMELTDSQGQIVWQASYRSWGAIEQMTVNEIEQNLRLQGQYSDSETGPHYNTFRYYSPDTGRFVTQDPIGLIGSVNLYACAVNPVGWIDPLGLSEFLALVREAHGLLDKTAQKFKTTAIGLDKDGGMFISSSDKTVPRIQREWAQQRGISVVSGVGHAEETIIKGGKGATTIDASRGVCLDCEHLMKEHNVKTNTHTTGRKSRKRIGGSTCSGV